MRTRSVHNRALRRRSHASREQVNRVHGRADRSRPGRRLPRAGGAIVQDAARQGLRDQERDLRARREHRQSRRVRGHAAEYQINRRVLFRFGELDQFDQRVARRRQAVRGAIARLLRFEQRLEGAFDLGLGGFGGAQDRARLKEIEGAEHPDIGLDHEIGRAVLELLGGDGVAHHQHRGGDAFPGAWNIAPVLARGTRDIDRHHEIGFAAQLIERQWVGGAAVDQDAARR